MKKLGEEAIVFALIVPWMIWVTVGLFTSKEVDAVQKSQNTVIIEKLDELKQHIKEIKNGH